MRKPSTPASPPTSGRCRSCPGRPRVARSTGRRAPRAGPTGSRRTRCSRRRRSGAAVVVHRRVVEPVRDLGVLVAGGEERRVGERVAGSPPGSPGRRRRSRGRRTELAAAVPVRLGGLVHVGQVALGVVERLVVVDDVGGVVGDDVEEDLHARGRAQRR